MTQLNYPPPFVSETAKLKSMGRIDVSELIVEADFLWHEIGVGDQVQVEESIWDHGVELLTPGKEYMVLAKQRSDTGVQSFLTESNCGDQTAVVYPHSVCNYVHKAQTWLC